MLHDRRPAAAAACLTLASLPLTFLDAPLAVGATLALTGRAARQLVCRYAQSVRWARALVTESSA